MSVLGGHLDTIGRAIAFRVAACTANRRCDATTWHEGNGNQVNTARELRGASVLVIGGSSGIGPTFAQRAHAAGASVAIASRSPERLAAARRAIGPDVSVCHLDVSDADQVEKAFGSLGKLDHVARFTATLFMVFT